MSKSSIIPSKRAAELLRILSDNDGATFEQLKISTGWKDSELVNVVLGLGMKDQIKIIGDDMRIYRGQSVN